MQKALKKFFTNESIFNIIGVLAMLLGVFGEFMDPYGNAVAKENMLAGCVSILCVVSMLFLMISYAKHEKNVMKGLIGTVLAFCLVLKLNAVLKFVGTVSLLEDVFYVLAFVCLMLITIIHFVINSDHHSSPKLVYTNQLLSLLYAIILIVHFVLMAMGGGAIVMSLAVNLRWIATILFVVMIESLLDEHRLEREANGWTGEKKA